MKDLTRQNGRLETHPNPHRAAKTASDRFFHNLHIAEEYMVRPKILVQDWYHGYYPLHRTTTKKVYEIDCARKRLHMNAVA